MHVTVRFVGRNVVLLLTDGAHVFVFLMYLNNCLQAEQQAPNRYSYYYLTMTESCLIKQHILIQHLLGATEL